MNVLFEVLREGRSADKRALSGEAFKIGRLPSCQLWLDDPTVSRIHAVVEMVGDDGLRVVDISSASGTTKDGVEIDVADLKSGDVVQFGAVSVRVIFPYEEVEYVPPPKATT